MSASGSKSGVHLFRYRTSGPMKYGPFLKIRSRSALDSKSNRKYPLPTEEDAPFCEISGLQFLWTQPSMVFGEGHNPVSMPIRARYVKDNATLMVSSGGRETTGISSNFLTNIGGIDPRDFLTCEDTKCVNRATSEGEEEGYTDSPSLDAIVGATD